MRQKHSITCAVLLSARPTADKQEANMPWILKVTHKKLWNGEGWIRKICKNNKLEIVSHRSMAKEYKAKNLIEKTAAEVNARDNGITIEIIEIASREAPSIDIHQATARIIPFKRQES